ncbi:MAG: AAA domain-containing protein [Bryobacteraceae bacterium]
MALFDDLEIPRRALGERIALELLRGPAGRPVHLHGPEGYGKRSAARALAQALRAAGRPVARVSSRGADGQSALEFLNYGLIRALADELGSPIVVPEVDPDKGDAGRATLAALTELATAAGARPVFIVEGAEWLWLAQGVRAGFLAGYGQDPEGRGFDLVTLSAFSASALGIRDQLDERPLLPFNVAAGAANPFLPGDAAPPVAEDSEILAEIRAWIESRQARAKRGRALAQVAVDNLTPVVRDCIARQGGHPRLSIASIDSLLRESERNDLAAMPLPVQIFETQLLSWKDSADEFREWLFPQLTSPETLPEVLCERSVHALELLIAELEPGPADEVDPHANETWIGLGLRQRRPAGERPEDGFPQMNNWITPDWLMSRIDALRARIRDGQERRKRRDRAIDPYLPSVEREVKRFFCKSSDDEKGGGHRAGCRLLDLETRVVERELQYKLTLQRDIPAQTDATGPGPSHGKRHSRPVLARETLHVFRNVGAAGEQLWSQHNAMLRRLSAAGNPALPRIYHGGRITGESEGDSDDVRWGYLQIRDLGPSLSDRFSVTQKSLTARQPDEDTNKPVEAAVRAAELSRALALLHSNGFAHRRITLNAIKVYSTGDQTHLVLSEFEFALILDMLTLGRRSGTRALRDADEASHRDLPFWSLDRIRVAAEGIDENGFGVVTWAETDVHAMCALLCYLFTGGIDEKEELAAFNRALPRNELDLERRERGCEALSDSIRHALLDEAKWTTAKKGHEEAYREFLDQMRSLMEQGLSSSVRRRGLSADDLSRRISYCLDEYQCSVAQDRKSKFAVYYDVEHMGPNLVKLGVLDDDGSTPEGRALLENKLHEWLEATSEIRYREEGFFGKGGEARASARKRAKYMLVSDQVVMFAAPHLDPASKRLDHRLLRLSFTVYRSDVHLVASEESEKVPFPARFEIFASDRLDEIPRGDFADWHRIMRSAKRAADQGGNVASASLHFHRQLLLAKEELKRFPVKVTQSGDTAFLSLDRFAYRRARRGSEFIGLVLQTGKDDETIFVDAIEAWREEVRAGSAKLQFVGKSKGGGGVRVDLDVRGSEDRRIVVRNHSDFPGSGHLVFSDLAGATHASLLQAKAVDKLLGKRNLFRHLDRPRNDAPVLMRAPVDYEQKYGETAVTVIQNIKSGHPITALQGPPGSGKSTMIALLIADMLQEDESLRFLVTSQSHAAVDVTLEKVVSVTSAMPGNAFSGDGPDVIRLLPGRYTDRVSQHVRENHSIKVVVDRKLARISKAAEDKLSEGKMTPQMKDAYLALRAAGTKGAFEVWNRIERHAPLVFGTTAASASARELGQEDFDVVIVDEAAKAFGIDIAQPLSIAHQVIMVGDHKQLSPFDYQGAKAMFERAREIYLNRELDIRVPEEVAVISDGENFEEALSWLTPFQRFFEKANNDDNDRRNSQAGSASPDYAPPSMHGPVPVAQMLATQHRSFEPIGALVSNTFYGGKVRTAPSLKLPDYSPFLPWRPVIEGEARTPVIIWVDTSNLKQALYEGDIRGAGKLSNRGEIEIVQRTLLGCNLQALREDRLAPEERCKVMSPYAEQVRRLGEGLRMKSGRFDPDIESNLDRIVQTIDSSQGAESAVVIVSMTRTNKVYAPSQKTDEGYEEAVRRSLGFLTDPARMNVMFSRASRQLVIVGKFSLFRAFDDLVKDWIAATASRSQKRRLDEAYGFWGRLLDHFQDRDLDANIIRVDATRIEGLID